VYSRFRLTGTTVFAGFEGRRVSWPVGGFD